MMRIDGVGGGGQRESRVRDHISVCVPTFLGPRMLARLLGCLALQDPAGEFDVSGVVVTNDAQASGRDVVDPWRTGCPAGVHYALGAVNTIAAARTRPEEPDSESCLHS